MNSTQMLSISQLRQNISEIIKSVSATQEPKVIMQRSQPKAVLVDVDYFKDLEEAVLELADSREAEKAKEETKLPFDQYLEKRWGKKAIK